MKPLYLIPLLFLSACSTTPKLALRPQPASPPMENSTVRYPEVVRAYHFGRYVDPNDDLMMHEQHTVFRVEENTRWDLHPPGGGNGTLVSPGAPRRDTAFSPVPVNDAVLAEVNAQKLATIQIMIESRTLATALAQFQTALAQTKTNLQETMALRLAINNMKHRLDTLEAAPQQMTPSELSTTNTPTDPLSP
jgi:hypothetical protein